MFVSCLLVQIMAMKNSFSWLNMNLSSLHLSVLLCIKALTVNVNSEFNK